jgi:hypothetical protein
MAAVLTGEAQTYAAIYRFSQHGFTTCLVMAAEMGPETHFSGDRHVWCIISQSGS